jgi:hypothetical protein
MLPPPKKKILIKDQKQQSKKTILKRLMEVGPGVKDVLP